MGEAKRRGSFQERYEQSIAKEKLRRTIEQRMVDEYVDNLTPEERHYRSVRKRKTGLLFPTMLGLSMSLQNDTYIYEKRPELPIEY